MGESLADDAAQGSFRALWVTDLKRNTMIIPEVKFCKIPLQVLLADVVINAVDAALQNREASFDVIGVSVATYIFLDRVVDCLVTGEALAHAQIDAALVSTQVRFRRNLLFDDRLEVGGVDVRNMEGRDATVALDQSDDRFAAWQLLCVGPVLRLAPDIGFIGFNELAFAT